MSKRIIYRGGEQLALYLNDDTFELSDGTTVVVHRSNITSASAGMADVIARHRARYGLVSLFCRPGKHVLDFPCGSGYGSERLIDLGVRYCGLDFDAATVEYARRQYGTSTVEFQLHDMRYPDLPEVHFDVVACIEGLEHIDAKYQMPLIGALHSSLRPGGTLVVSSPEAPGVSGPSPTNPEHKWELTKGDFVSLLHAWFGEKNTEVVSQHGIILSTGVASTCLYGVCHKEL